MITRYQVWLDMNRAVLGFSYPPPNGSGIKETKKRLEKGELVKVGEWAYAIVGSIGRLGPFPHEWFDPKEAAKVANLIQGAYVERRDYE